MSAGASMSGDLEEALRAILAVRLDTTPGVTMEQAIRKARVELRQIAEDALKAVGRA